MEPLDNVTIAILVISTLVALLTVLRVVIRSITSNKLRITNKNTGRSITISREYNREDSKKLIEFVK